MNSNALNSTLENNETMQGSGRRSNDKNGTK